MQVIKASGVTKDAKWIQDLHEELAQELTGGNDELLLGFIMDNTKGNRKAMQELQKAHPLWVCIGCQAHGLSLLIKDVAKTAASTDAKPTTSKLGRVRRCTRLRPDCC